MKTIIVATDFSPEAENALSYAADFANKIEARVILFNSFTIPIHLGNSILPAEALNRLEEENTALLEEKCKWLEEEKHLEAHYESGLMLDVATELNRLFKKYKADLIIMGMAGKSVAQDIFGNTTTSAIMKHSYPVLAVPEEVGFSGINNIPFAYDKMKEGHHEISAKICELAEFFDSKVEVFHVQKLMEKKCERKRIEKEFTDANYDFKEVESDEIIEEIENEIKRWPADLLVMVPQKYNFWESLLHRSKTRMMASRSAVPVLSIPLVTSEGEGAV
ncbi:universal stress protein [Zunongwangia sp. F363]|uniref:Universal stress protein n=1 Tax=Autumnicola tepida TaxID=3075595 RepID=A0ABU3CCV8_9FLAO|nr:universal stress protein [Zunongwangia sp. F363]MDT0644169.1 universal stress protein [Zunongwangia sp. F363]